MTTARRTYPFARLHGQLVEIPRTAREDMRVAARIFADDGLWDQIRHDRTVEQLVNVATLPGIEAPALAMPEPTRVRIPGRGVAAFRAADGIISPGGVGYDINCGVRLLASGIPMADLRPHVGALMHELSRAVPSGTGQGGRLVVDRTALDGVLAEGSGALLERGLATMDDLAHTEAGGALPGADPDAVSDRAKQRGHDQLGTLGSGNHFVEVQEVAGVMDEAAATAMALRPGDCVVLIHTGSRGLGHQVCTDYVRAMDAVMRREGIHLPDRELACAPFRSPEGRRYFGAMRREPPSRTGRPSRTLRELPRGALAHVALARVRRGATWQARHGDRQLVVHRRHACLGPRTPRRRHGTGGSASRC
jgi:tRNA-splicing ligase RtcB